MLPRAAAAKLPEVVITLALAARGRMEPNGVHRQAWRRRGRSDRRNGLRGPLASSAKRASAACCGDVTGCAEVYVLACSTTAWSPAGPDGICHSAARRP